MKTASIPRVVAVHAEEAAFLWLQRDAAVAEPHYSLKDLTKLDGRLEAHLDGLRIAGNYGWQVVRNEMMWKEPGESFVAARIALERDDLAAFEEVLESVLRSKNNERSLKRALVSSLGWASWPEVEPMVRGMLASDEPDRIEIGIAAAAIHRSLEMGVAERLLGHSSPKVRSRAYRACGEMMFSRLARDLDYRESDEDAAFWACWSGALMGDVIALQRLQGYCRVGFSHAERAVELVGRKLSIDDGLAWQGDLQSGPGSSRLAIKAASAVGDPALIDSLLLFLNQDAHSRVAGEAISTITGVDLALQDLETPPVRNSAGFDDQEPTALPGAADDGLSWPQAELVAAWWEKNRRGFAVKTRHLCGKPISPVSLGDVLISGRQRQRRSAAVQLALLGSELRPLFEWRARGDRQCQQIEGIQTQPSRLR